METPGGGIYIDVPDFEQADWDHVVIRARSENEVSRIGVGFNLREGSGASTDFPYPYEDGEDAPVIRDGTVQTYRFQTDLILWKQLGLWFGSNEPGSIEVLSVSLVSKAAVYAEAPHGASPALRGRQLRRALYTHAPGRVEYPVRVPEAGRLDVGLGVLRDDAPVTFAITATQQDGAVETLLEETYADREHWGQRSVDLSNLAGQTVTLALEAEAARAGTVALWAAPTLREASSGKAGGSSLIKYVSPRASRMVNLGVIPSSSSTSRRAPYGSTSTFNAYVEDDGRRYVRHYLLDFGATLGSGSTHVKRRRAGYEYYVEPDKIVGGILTFGLRRREWMKVDYPDYPSVGRYEADFFEPWKWKPQYPNPAFDRMDAADAFWAARIVASFTDDMIRAIVAEGRLSDPDAAAYLTDVIITRRNKVVHYWISRTNPLDHFEAQRRADAELQLTFENAAIRGGRRAAGSQLQRSLVGPGQPLRPGATRERRSRIG